MDKLKMDEFIARLDVNLEIKNLLNEGLEKAHGNWFTFLHELEMVMVENEDFEKARRYGETSLSLANHIINLSESKGEIDKYQAARYKAEIENSKQALTIVFREFQGVGDSNYHMYRFKDYKWGY